MTTISFKIPVAVAARLAHRANAEQKPKSVLIREFIERGLGDTLSGGPSFHDLAKDSCGLGRSGLRDLATHPKHLAGYGR